jgi:hypothetical protein
MRYSACCSVGASHLCRDCTSDLSHPLAKRESNDSHRAHALWYVLNHGIDTLMKALWLGDGICLSNKGILQEASPIRS